MMEKETGKGEEQCPRSYDKVLHSGFLVSGILESISWRKGAYVCFSFSFSLSRKSPVLLMCTQLVKRLAVSITPGNIQAQFKRVGLSHSGWDSRGKSGKESWVINPSRVEGVSLGINSQGNLIYQFRRFFPKIDQ